MGGHCFAEDGLSKFTVYAFIPWATKTSEHARTENDLSDYMLTYGIQPIYVIYENNYFTHGKIDLNKIKNLALKTALKQKVPVSFDMEFGHRFKPETVIPRVKIILNYYRSYNAKAFVGIYATIPQNTYGLKPTGFVYDQLNHQYDTLINEVNFISPSLYNYTGHDMDAWLVNTRFNMDLAKKYTPSRPIIPYISPIIRIGPSNKATYGNLVEELNEDEMTQRLDALYHLGASGCIIWASSQDRAEDGQVPQFNPDKGWGKAVVHFIATHAE
jgi:hypothetical protein